MATRSHLLGVVAAALLLTLSACGDSESSPKAAVDGETSVPAREPFDSEGSQTHTGRIKAVGPDERAVAEVWVAYWEARGTAYHEAKVDAEALGAVAEGDALQEVVSYVAKLKADGQHLVGDTRVGVSRVEIQGSTARVTSCLQGRRRVAGTEAGPTEYANVLGTLTKVNGTWLVSTKTVTGDNRCEA